MNAQPEALKRAHIKPGDKLYVGGHGTHHFSEGHDLHLQESVVDRLVQDGLLAAEPSAPQAETPPTGESPAASAAEPTTAQAEVAPAAEGEHQA